MANTFLFEELDGATREYLTAVRQAEGSGSPGVFATAKDSLPGIGCFAGPILVVVTLLLTIPTWTGIIFHDPVNVAMLQTAGLLLGGWLLLAGVRAKSGSTNAGAWVYADPLHLYEGFREQVTVTNIEEVADANYTHNYDSNGNYQNSVVAIATGRRKGGATVTLQNEARAEQMVTYLNYLAWARGPDGGDRADLTPADLGALARYVSRNEDEPKDANGNIDLSAVELDITEVPEEPAREGRAMPSFLPYILMFVGGVLCFAAFAFLINPVVRDDAIFDRVTAEPQQPGALRAYLIDPRNRLHREEVIKKLPRFYTPAITHVQEKAANKELGQGMAEVLTALSTAEQPVVSLRVTETQSPAGMDDTKGDRESKLRTEFADGVSAAFANQPWGRQVQAPPGYTWNSPTDPPPLGHQLIAFVEPPEPEAGQAAKPVHFDIAYAVKDNGNGQYQVVVNVTLRADIAKDAVGSGQFTVTGTFTATDFQASNMTRIKDELIRQMIGQ